MKLLQCKRKGTKVLAAAGLLLAMYGLNGCKKMIEIDPPVATVPTEEAFASNSLATGALAGLYSQMMSNSGSVYFSNGSTSIYGGLSADELQSFSGNSVPEEYQFYSNTLIKDNVLPEGLFWDPAYKIIYTANGIIEGVAQSTSVFLDDSTRALCTGESKFVRAFCYFYLTNMFGDVPMPLTTDFRQTTTLHRSPQADVYKQIVQDLQDATKLLRADYSSAGGNERIRVNKYGAAALLARVYLYQQDWKNAEIQADSVINSGLYSLESDLNNVFLKNGQEAIFQLKQNPLAAQQGVITEAKSFVPAVRLSQFPPADQATFLDSATFSQFVPLFIPAYYLTPQLTNAFEPGDKRRTTWIDSVPTPATEPYHSILYYYSCKYPDQVGNTNAIPNRYYMVLRLAEQYLIRAEARAQQNNTGGAATDLNMVRNRAGLPNTTAGSKDALLAAVAHERQTELFTEWGHRWLDLKRTGKANQVLGAISNKQPWKSYQLIYPIPVLEIQNDPNLGQNPGY